VRTQGSGGSVVGVEGEIRLYGDAALRRLAAEVTVFDAALQELAARLLAVRARVRAIGVAATQIAVERNLFAVDEGRIRRGGRAEVLVNPIVIATEGEIVAEEGCLSFPGIFINVARPQRIALRAQDPHGRPLEREAAGMLARAYLHEIDHLQGRLFIDGVDESTRSRVQEQMRAYRQRLSAGGKSRDRGAVV